MSPRTPAGKGTREKTEGSRNVKFQIHSLLKKHPPQQLTDLTASRSLRPDMVLGTLREWHQYPEMQGSLAWHAAHQNRGEATRNSFSTCSGSLGFAKAPSGLLSRNPIKTPQNISCISSQPSWGWKHPRVGWDRRKMIEINHYSIQIITIVPSAISAICCSSIHGVKKQS